MKKGVVTILALLLLATGSKGEIWDGEFINTKEGFSTTSTVVNFKNAWASTVPFLFFTKAANGYGVGLSAASGVIVFKRQEKNFAYLGILTAAHVLRTRPENIHPDVPVTVVPFKEFASDLQKENILTIKQFDGANIISQTIAPKADLAFVVIKVSSNEGLQASAAKLVRNCNLKKGDPIALIGYPSAYFRSTMVQRIPIDQHSLVVKRVSTGFFEGESGQIEGVTGVSYGTTVDSLPGNSGGPAINKEGEVVGISSGSLIDDDYKYYGQEVTQSLKPHSYIVGCQASKDFAKNSWQKFIQSLPQAL
ncbi:S1 family peptidase [Bdellovibrio sp. HCB117]|uniref:S1 family peptidase n=1 Tax=Bdellovibrio sp. HCB117 TaxID=3394359 RepID=UPI0039B3C800